MISILRADRFLRNDDVQIPLISIDGGRPHAGMGIDTCEHESVYASFQNELVQLRSEKAL